MQEADKMEKMNKMLIAGGILCFLIMIIGFFLYANLFPMQDLEFMSQAEQLELKKELAINIRQGM